MNGKLRAQKLKSDLKTFFHNITDVYPTTFKIIIGYQQISFRVILLIIASFYLDSIIRLQFSQIHNLTMDYIFSFGHWFGSGGPTVYLFLIFYIAGIITLNDKIRNTGLLTAESFLFSGIVSLTLKSAFGRWRPYTEHGSSAYFGFAFGPNEHLSLPSGHTTVAFALSSVLAGTTNNKYIKSFFYLMAIITAFSRIYHDQHWFSDVFLSAVIGTLIGNVLVYMNSEKFEMTESK